MRSKDSACRKLKLPKATRLRKWQNARLRKRNNPRSVEKWTFGEFPPSRVKPECPASKFSDFVYLQRLASHLRAELAQDIQVRRKPT
jgi:hypothetical protein